MYSDARARAPRILYVYRINIYTREIRVNASCDLDAVGEVAISRASRQSAGGAALVGGSVSTRSTAR